MSRLQCISSLASDGICAGDDSIAISNGSSNIKISNITCINGHGIRYNTETPSRMQNNVLQDKVHAEALFYTTASCETVLPCVHEP